MTDTIILKEENGTISCNIPLTKEQWIEILKNKGIVSPERHRAILALYYMPGHRASCTQCAHKFGGHFNIYNSAITSLGESIIKSLGSFRILDSAGKDVSWPVAIGVSKPLKGNSGVFEWTLRSELVEALREEIIENALSIYTDIFPSNWKNEEYKWRALKTFKDNWNIDAPDFADMLSRALSNTQNLLTSQSTFPRLMIISYAKQAPEAVRKMFQNLYDELLPLELRMTSFIKESNNLSKILSPTKNHYQNSNAVSTYLWLRYPEKYYIYKYGEFKSVSEKIGFDIIPKRNGNASEAIKAFKNYDILQKAIAKSPKLLNIYKQLLYEHPDKYFSPKGLATLTFDFGFWISREYSSKNDFLSPTPAEEVIKMRESTAYIKPAYDSDANYWWLVANPKYWSFSELNVGETVEYTIKNDKGNKRRIPINFENAKEGDIVVGYEANPVKKIVALTKVVKTSNGETISFQKIEELETPIPFATFRNLSELSEMEFLRNNNGSFFKLTPNEYEVIINLIRQENAEPEDVNPIKRKEDIQSYSREQFLNEVFITEDKLNDLIQLLRLKKNIILQGAPGVGKTFSAKRLAYCIMGEKNNNQIEMVQFHQNYSYEDFIMGYRPTSNGGFELRAGVFYKFCKKAQEKPDKPFFFLIDEINRGNLSQIFGELLMLIENNYRNHSIKLTYKNELFSVPDNVFIIGMMNTADRSLAIIDYALRRRFSFHQMEPGYNTKGFKNEIAKHKDPRIAKVVNAVVSLNDAIKKDDSLGSGFCIGHSYFCAQPIDEPWIEHVVRYDICPMLEEYWFDSKEKYELEKSRLLDILK